jgi:protein SCO1/2
MMKRLVVVGLAVAILGSACSSSETTAELSDVDPLAARPIAQSSAVGRSVADIALPDVANGGRPFLMQAQDDEILVLYFGFTSCPDICPTTLADLRQALGLLGDAADDVQVAMVTIDPERDSDETMLAYLRSFIENGTPLRTADIDKLNEVAVAFDADFDVVQTADGDVEVFHTAYLYAIDNAGIIRIIWPFGAEPGDISGDLAGLLEGRD